MSKIYHVYYNSILSQQTVTWSKSAGNIVSFIIFIQLTFHPFIAISWPIGTIHHYYIMYSHWARKHSLVYNVPSVTVTVTVTVTVRYNIKAFI